MKDTILIHHVPGWSPRAGTTGSCSDGSPVTILASFRDDPIASYSWACNIQAKDRLILTLKSSLPSPSASRTRYNLAAT